MLRRYTIWDVDNCLSDDEWRLKYVDFSKKGDDRYVHYNSLAINDTAANIRIFRMFIELGCTPVFISGRPEYMRDSTTSWLRRHLEPLGMPTNPIMYLRATGTSGLVPRACKEKLLADLLRDHFITPMQVVAAFDDIEAVVEMYRHHGIPASVLRIHNKLLGAYDPEDLK